MQSCDQQARIKQLLTISHQNDLSNNTETIIKMEVLRGVLFNVSV